MQYTIKASLCITIMFLSPNWWSPSESRNTFVFNWISFFRWSILFIFSTRHNSLNRVSHRFNIIEFIKRFSRPNEHPRREAFVFFGTIGGGYLHHSTKWISPIIRCSAFGITPASIIWQKRCFAMFALVHIWRFSAIISYSEQLGISCNHERLLSTN